MALYFQVIWKKIIIISILWPGMVSYGLDSPLQLARFHCLFKESLIQGGKRNYLLGLGQWLFGKGWCNFTVLYWYWQKVGLKTYFCYFFSQGKCLEMAKPLPVVAQEDLDSFTLTRTGSGFALKAFHVSWNTQISVRLLTSQNATERYVSSLVYYPCRLATQNCTDSTGMNHSMPTIIWSPNISPFLEIPTC